MLPNYGCCYPAAELLRPLPMVLSQGRGLRRASARARTAVASARVPRRRESGAEFCCPQGAGSRDGSLRPRTLRRSPRRTATRDYGALAGGPGAAKKGNFSARLLLCPRRPAKTHREQLTRVDRTRQHCIKGEPPPNRAAVT